MWGLSKLILASRNNKRLQHDTAALAATAITLLGLTYVDSSIAQQQKNAQDRRKVEVEWSKHRDDSEMNQLLYLYKTYYQNHFHSCKCEHALQPNVDKIMMQRRSTLCRLNENSLPIRSLNAKYKVLWKKPIGEGAFSTVYSAKNRSTHEKVAIKKIPKLFTDSTAFQNEIDALLHILHNGGHPHICSLNETFEDKKNFYLVLDLVNGGEMFDHLIKLGAYSEADAARLIREAAMALCFIHGIGIVHGDLKPENLMLSTDRKEDR